MLSRKTKKRIEESNGFDLMSKLSLLVKEGTITQELMDDAIKYYNRIYKTDVVIIKDILEIIDKL